MQLRTVCAPIVAFACVALLFTASATACPGCLGPAFTLSEQLDQADAVVLVKWISSKPTNGQVVGNSTYEIVDVMKHPVKGVPTADGSREVTLVGNTERARKKAAPRNSIVLKPGTRITLTRYRAGKQGDQFLLMGDGRRTVEWSGPLKVTDASYQYIAQIPKLSKPAKERLTYYMAYLEHPEPLIAHDAYGEFANAPYKDIKLLTDQMPREKIREWIVDPETSPMHLGFYGLLLGLSGNEDDVALLEKKITEPGEEFRLGIDLIMWGYLLLTGEKGLDNIDRWKLKPVHLLDRQGKPVLDDQGKPKLFPFSEAFAAKRALGFMWAHAEGVISKERLRQSMRLLLNRPELTDLVVTDLARWQDWSVQDQLMELYAAEEYNIPPIKRAIVRYMLVSSKFKPKNEGDEPPAHVAKAKKYLAQLRQDDPKTVTDAERFFFFK